MQLYCPNCQAAFSGATRCPRCDGRLFTPDEPVETPAAVPDPAPDRFVRPSLKRFMRHSSRSAGNAGTLRFSQISGAPKNLSKAAKACKMLRK